MHATETLFRLRLITNLPFLLLITAGAQGRITRFPPDSVVLKGKTNVNTCCSDIQKTFFWKHKPAGSSPSKDINDLVGLANGYLISGRFNVTLGNSAGCHSLVTKDVTRGDEGMYSCTDDAGLGHSRTWELIILESFDCEETNRKVEYMGVNDFGLPQDVISFVCIAKYRGNVHPIPTCEWSSGNKLLDNYHRVTDQNLTTTLTFHMPAGKEFNGDQLLCYVRIDGENSDHQAQTEWKSSRTVVNYASFHRNGIQRCSPDELSLDCHPPCNHTVKLLSNGSSCCEITYPSKNAKFCILLPVIATGMPGATNIYSSTPSPVESPIPSSDIVGVDINSVIHTVVHTITMVIVLLMFIAIAFFISWAVRFIISRCRKEKPKPSTQPDGEVNEMRSRRLSNAPITVGEGGVVMINSTSTVKSPSIHQNAFDSVNDNKDPEAVPFLNGVDTTARTHCVINYSDAADTALNGASCSLTETANMKPEKKPGLLSEESYTKTVTFSSATPNSKMDALGS